MARHFRDPAREQSWRERVLAWMASGLSVRAFCQQHHLIETTFQHWRRELRERDASSARIPSSRSPSSSSSSRPTFVPVTVIPTNESAQPVMTIPVEVRCPSGHVVSLPNADAGTLRHLFASLTAVSGERSPC